MRRISIQEADFDLVAEIALLTADKKDIGAIVNFIGKVRDINKDQVTAMTLEHYPGMTEKTLTKIAKDAESRWQLHGITIIHRIGTLVPGDNIALVITASRHRHDAFAAGEFTMDFIKTKAPFWKKENIGDIERWIESRQTDFDKLTKWKNS